MIVVVALTTDDQIEIDLRDDASALARLLTLPVSARLEALAELNGVSGFDESAVARLTQGHPHWSGCHDQKVELTQ